MAHDLVAGHEAVGIISLIRATRKLDRPVGDDQAEAVPAAAPRLSHSASLQHHVLDSGLGKLVAQRETRLASANDHDFNSFGHAITRQPPELVSCAEFRMDLRHVLNAVRLVLNGLT